MLAAFLVLLPAFDLIKVEDPVRKAIAAQNARYAAAVTKQDLPAFLALFADDAVLVQAGTTIKGAKEIEKAAKAQLDAVTDPVLKTTALDVRRGLAYEKGEYTVKSRKDDGKSSGTYFVVWKKVKDEWKILAEVTIPGK